MSVKRTFQYDFNFNHSENVRFFFFSVAAILNRTKRVQVHSSYPFDIFNIQLTRLLIHLTRENLYFGFVFLLFA